jgi:hypothetical protein
MAGTPVIARTVSSVIGALLVAVQLQAQAVRLHFDPPDGLVLHRLFQIHTRVMRGGEGVRTREAVELGGVREVTLRGPAHARMLHLSYDSLRTRLREGTDAWREVVGGSDSAWVQVRFDDRLRATIVAVGGTGAEAARLVGLATGLPGLVLPGDAVRAGDVWESRLELPIPGAEPGAPAGSETLLTAHVAVSVDSVVARSRDTLAFLSVSGVMTPTPSGGATYTGGVRGTLVWSSGWQAFVSGATRTRIEVGPWPESADSTASLVLETTVRQQVRPPS